MRNFCFFTFLTTTCAAPALAQDLPSCEAYPRGEVSYACMCDAEAISGSVWGSGTYTADSSVCAAAVHSGVITLLGGSVLAVAQDGLEGYVGSSANGVESRNWGSYGASFAFDPKGPRFVSISDAPACSTFDASLEVMRCSCPAGLAGGSVWGSGPYTADSNICAAATHAGLMSEMGGEVTVMLFAGLEAYVGSEQNGVVSRDWRSYGTSIVFDANQ